MKVHKKSKVEYQPFFKYIEKNSEKRVSSSKSSLTLYDDIEEPKLENYAFFLQSIIHFEADLVNISEPEIISAKLKQAVKGIIAIQDAALLIVNESENSFIPITSKEPQNINDRLNHYNREGILNIVFESKNIMVLPELNSYDAEGPKFNYILFPLYENDRRRGLFAILVSSNNKKISNLEKQTIQVLITFALNKIDKVLYKNKLNYIYQELQTYQAKLSNDFRLAAIGELTDGILEDIMTPLQVITSYIDLLEQDNGEINEIKKIKSQVAKINASINRIVKFSNLNQRDLKIQPCNLNEVITEYYGLVKSTIANLNMELVLDFEKNIPSILTHPSYIFQLINTLITIIKTKIKGNGGLVLQTRFKSDFILVRLISSANLITYNNYNDTEKTGKTIDLNTRIVENLMNKHEGKISIETFDENSSIITLSFPLIRKIRK